MTPVARKRFTPQQAHREIEDLYADTEYDDGSDCGCLCCYGFWQYPSTLDIIHQRLADSENFIATNNIEDFKK